MEEETKAERKKYWLKLDKDFLKSPQMKVIKNMPNGKDYIIFYLSLMLESVETVGHLRFTSLVPYNADMLSSVTDTNIDIVKNAIQIFCELGMMQIFDDGTIFMTEVPKITGKECESAERVRKYRLKQQEEKQKMLQCNNDVTKSNAYIEEEKDKYKNKKEEIRNKNIEEEFEEVWQEYPKKQGKANALKAYIKAIKKGTDKQIIINGLKRYLEYIKIEKIETRYIKQGSTWFNQECWNDDYSIKRDITTSDLAPYMDFSDFR